MITLSAFVVFILGFLGFTVAKAIDPVNDDLAANIGIPSFLGMLVGFFVLAICAVIAVSGFVVEHMP